MLNNAAKSWDISEGWSAIQIAFLSLFIIFVVTIILITVGFWLYRRQLKKIIKIDQNIEIINRYPLEEAINRLEKINEKNNQQFNQFYRLVRIKYLTILEDTFKVAGKHFLTGVKKKEFTKLTYRSIMKLSIIEQAIEKAKVEFDTLHELLNDFFTYEYELRDIMIDLKNQVNLIKSNYAQQINQSQKKFPQTVFNDYLGYIFKFINLIHNYLVVGDYQTAFDKLLKILTWAIKVNEETVIYPKIYRFLNQDLSVEINQIEHDWASDSLTFNRAKNRFKFLKEQTSRESEVALQAIENLDFKRTKISIDNILKEISAFKSELVYEEEIKTFFKFKGPEIKVTIQMIEHWIENLTEEQLPEFKQYEKEIYDNLSKPSARIQRNLTRVNNQNNEKELENLKKLFNDDLKKIDDHIYLLTFAKTINSKLEEQFMNYLNISFEIKTNLIVISNVLKGANRWLTETQLVNFNDDYYELYQQIVKDEVTTLNQFNLKYPDQVQKDGLFTRLTNIKNYSYKLKSTLVYEYQLYYLSTALLPLLEFGQNEGKINNVYNKMANEIDAKNYEQAIDQFINNINTIYYQV